METAMIIGVSTFCIVTFLSNVTDILSMALSDKAREDGDM